MSDAINIKEPVNPDIFEVAQELYEALDVANKTLNWVRRTKVHMDGYKDSYEVASMTDKVLLKYKDKL